MNTTKQHACKATSPLGRPYIGIGMGVWLYAILHMMYSMCAWPACHKNEMVYHVTPRCALISCCYAIDKNALAECCSQGLVCVSDLHVYALKRVSADYVCTHSLRPRCPRSERTVSSPCARFVR